MLLLIPARMIFVLILPLLFLFAGEFFDAIFPTINLNFGIYNFIIGVIIAAFGFIFAFWTVKYQYDIGKGTPIPKSPPQKLLTNGPYAYCRNPMSFGTILLYIGFIFIFKTFYGLILVFLFSAILLTYIKLSEEKTFKIALEINT